MFVCSGNTCRSPLAWAAWQVVVRQAPPAQRAWLQSVAVSSAGLNARAGAPASELARRVAARWDVDLSGHRARPWNGQGARADWIVAMTGAQVAQMRFALETRAPAAVAPRVRALGLPVADGDESKWPSLFRPGQTNDIFDPYGGSFEAYEECGARILRGVRALALELSEAR